MEFCVSEIWREESTASEATGSPLMCSDLTDLLEQVARELEFVVGDTWLCRADRAQSVLGDLVVEPDHGELELTEDAVLVVAEVADHRDAVVVALKILGGERSAIAGLCTGQQLHTGGVGVVQVRAGLAASAVDAVEVELRRARVRDGAGIIDHAAQTRRHVERDVVVDEL